MGHVLCDKLILLNSKVEAFHPFHKQDQHQSYYNMQIYVYPE